MTPDIYLSARPIAEERSFAIDVHLEQAPTSETLSNQRRVQASSALTWLDWLCLLLVAIFCLALPAYRGRNLIFWEDEVLGWLLLSDPSWRHMLFSWVDGADGGGISFYLTGRAWFHIFGQSVASFRAYSDACFAVAYGTLWLSLRRFYSREITTVAILVACFSSLVLLQHYTEGRFYGLLMAGCAFALAMALKMCRSQGLSSTTLALAFAANALLVTTHQLGIVYSGAILFAVIVYDWSERRIRLRAYASVAASWLLLLPCLPAIRATAAVGKPHFWTRQPGLVEFAVNYSAFTTKVGLIIVFLLMGIVVMALMRGELMATARGGFAARKPIYIAAACIFLVPPLLLIEGFIAPPLCIARYLLPVTLATACLLAELLELACAPLRLFGWSTHRLPLRLGLAGAGALLVFGLACYDLFYRPLNADQRENYTDQLTAALTASVPVGVPVVCEDAFAFTELQWLQHWSPLKYTYLLDWDHSKSSQAPRLEVTQYHLMENWKKVGYYADAILYKDSFLKRDPLFYSLSFDDVVQMQKLGPPTYLSRSAQIGTDLHDTLAGNPAYRVSLDRIIELGQLRANVWRYCRAGAPQCN